MVGLTGRVDKLERLQVVSEGHCQRCGLRHAVPMTLALARSIIGVRHNGTDAEPTPAPPLCLCDCCGEQRELADLTHHR